MASGGSGLSRGPAPWRRRTPVTAEGSDTKGTGQGALARFFDAGGST